MKNKIPVILFLLCLAPAPFLWASGIQILRDVPSTYMYPCDGFLPFNVHRGTATLLSLMLPGASFDDPRGVACALLKTDHDPSSPQNDVVVTVIGVNSGADEIIYNVGLKDIRLFGSPGKGEKQFSAPTGAAIDSDGEVAIADTGNDRVALLKHDGLRLSWVGAEGKKGTGPGEFAGPMGVAYDSHGNLYVADTGNNRVEVRNPRGQYKILKISGLIHPSAIAVIDSGASWTFFRQGIYANRLAVIDRGGKRLQTFSLEGEPLSAITAAEIPGSPCQLWGCAFDYYGNLVATDFAASCLRKFDKDLHYVTSFGSPGTDDYQFTEPRGIAIQNQFGQVLVCEKDSVQYFWVGSDALKLRAEPEVGKIRFPFFLTERSYVTADIEGPGGTVVQNLARSQDLEQGPQELDWAPDTSVKLGPYVLRLKVMATYSSREREAKEITLPVEYSK